MQHSRLRHKSEDGAILDWPRWHNVDNSLNLNSKVHCSSCHTASPKANETNLCAIYPVVTQRWWTYLPSLSFGELSLSQQLLSVWAVPAPKYNRVFLTASPGDWLAVKNSPWLIWSSAGTGFIKPAPPCLQAVLWHSKEGVSFTDKTFMERQRWGLPCCPPSADPCLRVTLGFGTNAVVSRFSKAALYVNGLN